MGQIPDLLPGEWSVILRFAFCFKSGRVHGQRLSVRGAETIPGGALFWIGASGLKLYFNDGNKEFI